MIQTVPQPHVVSDWIKSSIPLYTWNIVCQEFLKVNAGRCHTRDSFPPSGDAWLHSRGVLCTILSVVPRNAVFLWQQGNRQDTCAHWAGPGLSSCLLLAHGTPAHTQVLLPWSVSNSYPCLLLEAQTSLTILWNLLRMEKKITIVSTHAGMNIVPFWINKHILIENNICAEQAYLRSRIRQHKVSQK